MNLNEAAENAHRTSRQREKNGAKFTGGDILKHCAGEVIEAAQARAELHNDERSMNQRNAAIIDGWVLLYICITTNDINEFYKALSGNVPRKGVKKYYTWETANKPYERNRK